MIAAEVKLTEPSLSKRIGTLVADGIIRKFTIDVNYSHRDIGFSTHAISLLNLKEQTDAASNSIVQRLDQIEEAVEVYTVFEKYDFCIRWLCRDPAHLMRVMKPILGDVQHIETIIFGEERKRSSGIGLLGKS